MQPNHTPDRVLDLWFPDNGHWRAAESHLSFWNERMQGGMDETICRELSDLTTAAARSELDHWAETPRGRLALLIALDQFPRSLWRDTPSAYGQDIKACRLALEGIENGHYAALTAPWERQFYVIAISHCEGPDHLQRMDLCIALSEAQRDLFPEHLVAFADRPMEQTTRVRTIIERFGRHPHRNPILGRISSPEEEKYIATGDFPHLNKLRSVEGTNKRG